MANLTTQHFILILTKLDLIWIVPINMFLLVLITSRFDSSSWQHWGMEFYYPNLSVNKYGLQAGEFYRAQGRTFCDSNITSIVHGGHPNFLATTISN